MIDAVRPSSRHVSRPHALALLLMLAAWAQPSRADFIDHFAQPDDVGIYKVPRVGSTNVLVIPLLIDDLPVEGGDEAAWLNEVRAFYAPDAEGFSFSSYWRTMSLGRFTPHAIVAAPVHFPSCPPIGGTADCAIERGAGFQSGDLQQALFTLRDALKFIDAVMLCAVDGPSGDSACTQGGGVDLGSVDLKGTSDAADGVTDGVILITNAGFPGIALPVKDISQSALITQLVGALPSFVYHDVTVGAVAIGGRQQPPQRGSFVTVHEFGHLLGFCDLYTETGIGTDMPNTLMGGWYYSTPASLLDGYSRAAAGFAHLVQATGSQTFTLTDAATTGMVVKVGTGDEFFMVELRERRDDVDGDMQIDRGVVVERVRLSKRPSAQPGGYVNTLQHYVNDDPDDFFLAVEQADGLFDLHRGRARKDVDDMFIGGDQIAPSDDTAARTPQHRVFSTNLLSGAGTGITIAVTDVSAGRATVRIDAPVVADPCAQIASLCGALVCSDGECGAPPAAVPPPPPQGCGCGAVDESAGALAFGLSAALMRRRRTQRWGRGATSVRDVTMVALVCAILALTACPDRQETINSIGGAPKAQIDEAKKRLGKAEANLDKNVNAAAAVAE